MKISDVLASTDQGTIALPEFQRGVEAAQHLIGAPNISDGFTALCEQKPLEPLVEAFALRPEFATLFTPHELDQARRRLAEFGFAP